MMFAVDFPTNPPILEQSQHELRSQSVCTHLPDSKFKAKCRSKSIARRKPRREDLILSNLCGDVSQSKDDTSKDHESIRSNRCCCGYEHGANGVDDISI